MKKFIKVIMNRLLKKRKYHLVSETEWGGKKFVQNINIDLSQNQKKVLLCYLDFTVAGYALQRKNCHTNYFEFFQILQVLIQKNTVIDVCFCNEKLDNNILEQKTYDYIIGFGSVFREAAKLFPKAVKIIYMTENPYYISVIKEKERIEYFEERKGVKNKLTRTGAYYHSKDENLADIIVTLGTESYYEECGKPVYRIYPTGLKNMEFEYCIQKKNKKCFMVFGTSGLIHKGIDLLLEVFEKHSDWTLYLCGNGITEGIAQIGCTLPKNCIDCGHVDVNSTDYLKLISKCYMTLLPSCSEGMPTGVLTCMRHGLIPVVTRGNGCDHMEEYCCFFEDYHIPIIEKTIVQLLNKPDSWYNEMSKKIYKYANQQFVLENYTKSIRKILDECMKE